ncbi:hypothetical protein V8E36_005492, partial [Tilletia maclaganii]
TLPCRANKLDLSLSLLRVLLCDQHLCLPQQPPHSGPPPLPAHASVHRTPPDNPPTTSQPRAGHLRRLQVSTVIDLLPLPTSQVPN